MKKKGCWILLLVAQWLLASYQVSVTISKNQATIADPLILKVIIKSPQPVRKVQLTQTDPSYEILKEGDLRARQLDQNWVVEKDLTIGFFRLGEFTVGPFEVTLYDGQGQELGTLSTRSIPVSVQSALEGETDIRDLKDPLHIGGNPLYVLKYVLLALLVAALAILGVWWFRRRQRRRGEPPAEELSPLAEFEQRIHRLKKKQLFEKGQKKTFSLELYRIIKCFLGRTYGVNAPDLTSTETIDFLSRVENLERLKEDFTFLFQNCDLIKFARFNLPEDLYQEVMQRLQGVIGVYRQRAREAAAKADGEER